MLTSLLLLLCDPQPGDLYREFTWHSITGKDWRVTDPAAVKKFPRAEVFLPNAVRTLRVADLDHAVRAELILDRWNGHRGTINKRVRFNGRDWLPVPEVDLSAADVRVHAADVRPEFLMTQDNPVLAVPLDHLREGDNTLEAACDEDGGFGWGQWGFFAARLRVYYDRAAKNAADIEASEERDDPAGRFAFSGRVSVRGGLTLTDQTTVAVSTECPRGVTRIEVLARVFDYDIDGDGVFREWREHFVQPSRGEPPVVRGLVASLTAEPYEAVWDTAWLPDQTAPVELIARVRDSYGYWSVTPALGGLRLDRDHSVRLLTPRDMGEDFGVRVDRDTLSLSFPGVDSAAAARLHLRTWHGYAGHHEPLDLNGRKIPVRGNEHFFDYDRLPVPPDALRPGGNTLTVRSTTHHHQLEVLWPGPAVAVKAPWRARSVSE